MGEVSDTGKRSSLQLELPVGRLLLCFDCSGGRQVLCILGHQPRSSDSGGRRSRGSLGAAHCGRGSALTAQPPRLHFLALCRQAAGTVVVVTCCVLGTPGLSASPPPGDARTRMHPSFPSCTYDVFASETEFYLPVWARPCGTLRCSPARVGAATRWFMRVR